MKARIAEKLGVREEQVYRITRTDDELSVLVDRGIGGITHHRLSLADLPPLEKFTPEPDPKPTPEVPHPFKAEEIPEAPPKPKRRRTIRRKRK